jgi:hypothetical protein
MVAMRRPRQPDVPLALLCEPMSRAAATAVSL